MASRTNVSNASKPDTSAKEGQLNELESSVKGQVAAQMPAEQVAKTASIVSEDLKKKKDEEESEESSRASRAIEESEASETVAESEDSDAATGEEVAESEGDVSPEEQASIDQIQDYASTLDASAESQLVAAQDFGNWFAQAASGAASAGAAGATAAGISTTAILAGVAVVGVAAAASGGSSSSGTTTSTTTTPTTPVVDPTLPPSLDLITVAGDFSSFSMDTSALATEAVPAAPTSTYVSLLSFTASNTIDLSATAGTLMATGGTDGSDLFEANGFAQLAGAELLGGLGIDKLKFSLDGGDGELNAAGDGVITSTGIEILEVTNTNADDPLYVNVGNMDDLQEVRNVASKGDLQVQDAAGDIVVALNGVAAGTTTVTYASTADATDTAATLVLEDVSAAAAVTFVTASADTAPTELVLSSNGADGNVLKTLTAAADIATLTVSGQGDLTITDALTSMAALTEIQAAELGGNLDLNLGSTATSKVDTVIAGSGDHNKITATFTADIAPEILRVHEMALTFTADAELDGTDILGLQSVSFKNSSSAEADFVEIESGVTFSTTQYSGTAGDATSFHYRNLSDFELDINAASTAAAQALGGIDLAKARNSTITASNGAKTVGLGDIDIDDSGRSLTLVNSGTAGLTAGNIDSAAEEAFMLSIDANVAKGEITTNNLDSAGDVYLNLTASKAKVTVDDVASTGGKVTAILNASGAAIDLGNVSVDTSGINLRVNATSNTTASGTGHDVVVGTLDATEGNIVSEISISASATAGDASKVTLDDITAQDGSVGLTITNSGGSNAVDTNFTGGNIDASGDVSVSISGGEGSTTAIDRVASTDEGGVSISIVNASSATNTGNVDVANGLVGDAAIVGGGQVSIEVTNGASGDVNLGDVTSNNSDIVFSVVSNGKKGEIAVGNFEALGTDGSVVISVLGNAGNVDMQSIDADGDVSITTEGTSTSMFTLDGNVDAQSGGLEVSFSGKEASIADGTHLASDTAASANFAVLDEGDFNVGSIVSNSSSVDIVASVGEDGNLDLDGATADTTLDFEVTTGVNATVNVGNLLGTQGDTSVTVTAESKATDAGNTDITFADIDSESGAVSLTLTDVGVNGLVTVSGNIDGSDSVTIEGTLQKTASFVQSGGNLVSDGDISVTFTGARGSAVTLGNIDSDTGTVTISSTLLAATDYETSLTTGNVDGSDDVSVTFVGGNSSVVDITSVDSASGTTTVSVTTGTGSTVTVGNVDEGAAAMIEGSGDVTVTAAIGASSSSTTSSLVLGNIDSTGGDATVSLTLGKSATLEVGDIDAKTDLGLTVSLAGNNSAANIDDLTADEGDISATIGLTYSSAGGSTLNVGEIAATVGKAEVTGTVGRGNALNVGNVDGDTQVDVSVTMEQDTTFTMLDSDSAGSVTVALNAGTTSGVTQTVGALTSSDDEVDVNLRAGATATMTVGNLDASTDVTLAINATTGATVSVAEGANGLITAGEDLTISVNVGGDSTVAIGNTDFGGSTISSTAGDITFSSIDAAYSSAGSSTLTVTDLETTDGAVKFTSINVGQSNSLTFGNIDTGGATSGDLTITKATVGTSASLVIGGTATVADDLTVTSLTVGTSGTFLIGNIDVTGDFDLTASLGKNATLVLGNSDVSATNYDLDVTSTGTGAAVTLGNIDADNIDIKIVTTSSASGAVTAANLEATETLAFEYKGMGAAGDLTARFEAGNTDGTTIDVNVDGSSAVTLEIVAEDGADTLIDLSGSSGDNSVDLSGSFAADVVKLGSGDSTVTGFGNGDDVIHLGTGVDTITYQAIASDTGNIDVYVGSGDTGITSATVDEIDGNWAGNGDWTFNGSISGLSGNIDQYVDVDMTGDHGSFAAFLTAANANLDGSTAFVYAGNVGDETYVVWDHNANGTVDSGDSILFLDGLEITDFDTEVSTSIHFIS